VTFSLHWQRAPWYNAQMPTRRFLYHAVALSLLSQGVCHAEVLINEVLARGSERLLRWTPEGVPKLGFGKSWYEASFDDGTWSSGNGPFGFGSFTNVSPAPPIGTNLATQMQNLTPTLYLRKTFTATADQATSPTPLSLEVQFNDGFVCYLNGVEVIRRNAGPPLEFKYRDSFAALGTPANTESHLTPYLRTETLTLPAANTVLVAGTNVIAIHALNHWENTTLHNQTTNATVGVNNSNNFYLKADLKLSGTTLVANNTAWRYLPGVVEPSGGFYDPTLIFQAKLNVPWGRPSFDDVLWATGPAPLGAGTPPSGVVLGTDLTSQIPGQAASLYCRIVFTATASDVADLQPLQLLMDWDDGFVAYLNGIEVARDRLEQAHSFTPHHAVASSARTPGSYATYTLDPPGRHLIEGQNVLAVQVHNVSLSDADLFLRAQLRTHPAGTNRLIVPANATWSYFVGTNEPLTAEDENIEDNPEAPDSSPDWVELHNNGTETVSLANWKLSDNPTNPAKWTFPAGASIPPGGYLVVICDSLNLTTPATGGLYHTNFSLSAQGESVVLSNAAGTVLDDITFGPQTASESFGRTADGSWAFLADPTPGAANSPITFTDRVATPQISEPPGFYPSTRILSLSCSTPGATIRYTLDGSEPTISSASAGTIVIGNSRSLRARAFKAGMLPSRTVTGTFLVNEPAGRQSVPALCLTADPERSLYRPYGVMAITGSFTNFTAPAPTGLNGTWTQTGSTVGSPVNLDAYNNVIHRGRFTEKPVNMEILRADGSPGPNIEFGLRVSGSNHARPRYQLTNQNRPPGSNPGPNDGPWSSTAFTQKPSFNFFFRNDLGGDPLEWPLFPDYPVNAFHDVRVRAGKNDPSNPFIEDEYMRRLFISTGQKGSRGMINTLYVNGVYKGYYNLCEHLREDFLQRHHGGQNAWDVRQVTVIASGDGLAFQEMITYLRTNPQTQLAAYQGMKTRLDLVNFIDYLLTNLVGVTGDWPHNNFVCARERTKSGLHRYYLWDAEGAFGDFGGHVRTNQFIAGTTGSIVTTNPNGAGLAEGIRILYTLLRASPEFKLLFADRIQKHFFSDGAFTEGRMLASWNAMKAEFAPLIAPTAVTDRVTPWFNGVGNPTRYTTSGATNTPSRRQVLFHGYIDDTAGGAFIPPHFVTEGLWPALQAPVFSTFGGTVAPGFQLTITHPNTEGTLYYTTDGRDPRAEGGAIQGSEYLAPVTLHYPGTVKARVRSPSGDWSPLTEAAFDTGVIEPLIISELMYHPADNGAIDGDEYEFLEIKNIGSHTVSLDGMSFTSGISYTFPAGSSLAAGSHLVLAKFTSRLAERYPSLNVFDQWGSAGGSLSNSGETVTLTNSLGRTVFSLTYSDTSPWPTAPDGNGPSLVPVSPNTLPDPNNPTYWRASTNLHGSPGQDDPAPPLPIYINEVLANATSPEVDWVELHNPNSQAVDLSHWWLSDSNGTPKKFRIPEGTIIPAGGYLLFTETDFANGAIPFGFSSSGERARIAAAGPDGEFTGYVDNQPFGASEPGVTFGRHVNSQGLIFFVAQKEPTPGSLNTGPRVGPVVISELMYNPPSGGDEFLELRNISAAPIALYDLDHPANGWRFNGITFSFPTGTVIEAGELLLVVPIAPATFRTKYAVAAATRIFGPYTGAQNNGGELIALEKPAPPISDGTGGTTVPYIVQDQVTYTNAAPWPTSPNGGGPSLERIDLARFGNDSQNWRASPSNGGSMGRPPALTFANWLSLHFTPAQLINPSLSSWEADPDQDGRNNFTEWALGSSPWQADGPSVSQTVVEDTGARYLHIQCRRSLAASGLQIHADTSTTLSSWSFATGLPVGAPIPNADGTETVTFRHPIPISISPVPHYIRLRLELP